MKAPDARATEGATPEHASLMYLSAQQVNTLLPMSECIDAMQEAMMAASSGTVSLPPRVACPLPNDAGFLGVMPGVSTLGYGAKIMTICPANPATGRPMFQGFVILFDPDTGRPELIADGMQITAIRTAAASGLATRALSREDARTCGIFGYGVQAAAHIDAMAAVRLVDQFLVWGRSQEKAQAFAIEQSQRTGYDVRACDHAAEAGACDLVCTVTASPDPVLLGQWVKAGAHVNLVGAHSSTTREADSTLIVKSSVYVDLLQSALREAGDLMIPLAEGVVEKDHIVGELGELLAGRIAGRSSNSQVTLYCSLGNIAQDIFAARHVRRRATQEGVGAALPL